MEVFVVVFGTLLIIGIAVGVVYGLRLCLKSTGSYSRYADETVSPYYIERSGSEVNSCPHRCYADYDSLED